MKSITVCVEYDDFLMVTLALNRKHFERTLVVTSTADTRTQAVVKRFGCDCLATDVFYAGGAAFNKGAAVEKGFDALGRDGWLCVWDADIVMPHLIDFADKDKTCLYTPFRYVLDDPRQYWWHMTPEDWGCLPMPTDPGEFAGYFQLFHASAIAPPWYSTDWTHAGGCDSDFEARFPSEKKKRPPYTVLHLGPEGMPELGTRVGRNWMGRVTPRIDTGEAPPLAGEKSERIRRMVQGRAVHGTSRERVSCSQS